MAIVFQISQSVKLRNTVTRRLKVFLVISIWSIKRIKNSFKKLNYAGQKIISTWNLLRVVQWHKVTRRKPPRLLHHSTRIVSRFTKIFWWIHFLPLYIFPDVASRDSKPVFVLGENLYSDFLYTRLVSWSDDLNKKKITKNSLKLPKDSDEVEAEKPRISINEKLINKLRGACNSRSLLAKQVFQGEWTGVPECFVTK